MTTITLSQRDELLSVISDVFKSIYGSRPTHYWSSDMTISELEEELQRLSTTADEQFDLDQQIQKENDEHFKNILLNIQKVCNCSKKKAIRHLLSANNLRYNDFDYLGDIFHLSYSAIQELKK